MNRLPKGYRVTIAPCRVIGQVSGAPFVTFRVWYSGHLIVGEASHGLVFDSRDKAREAGRERAISFAALNPDGPWGKLN